MEFDNPLRARLHAAVAREADGNFWRWAQAHGLEWLPVMRAAGMGGFIAPEVAAAVEKEDE